MAPQDFDIESLARYLHLLPQQILKMAERGHLPGRRHGGQWRFSEAEVHHWLEDRLGAAGNEADVSHVEHVLNVSQGKQDDITLEALLSPESMSLPLPARTKNSVITSMVELAGQTGWLWDIARMEDAVRTRENLHSTALDIGVALLHPRRPLPDILAQNFLALGRTSSKIPFGQENGQMTDVYFLICSLDDTSHLRILALLSRLLMETTFLPLIREATNPEELLPQLITLERGIVA
jgi:nitrogen PTS system EIIA component